MSLKGKIKKQQGASLVEMSLLLIGVLILAIATIQLLGFKAQLPFATLRGHLEVGGELCKGSNMFSSSARKVGSNYILRFGCNHNGQHIVLDDFLVVPAALHEQNGLLGHYSAGCAFLPWAKHLCR